MVESDTPHMSPSHRQIPHAISTYVCHKLNAVKQFSCGCRVDQSTKYISFVLTKRGCIRNCGGIAAFTAKRHGHMNEMSTGHCWNQRKGRNGSSRRRTRRSSTPSTTIPKWMALALNPARQPADCTLATAWILHITLLMYMKIKLLQHGFCSHPGKFSNLTAHFINLTPNKFSINPYLQPFWRDADSS
jgi:hypothetical protein